MKKLFSLLVVLLCALKIIASDSSMQKTLDNIGGVYKCGDERIYFDSDGKVFYVKRSSPKTISDAIVPLCYDTIASGNFKVVKGGVIVLSNNKYSQKVYYTTKQEKTLSKDTIYFKIILPNDDAFFPRRFNYVLYFDVPFYQRTFDSAFVVMPKHIIANQYSQTFFLSLIIKDLNPLGRVGEAKSYQRTSFSIFNSKEFDLSYNYFTIVLHNFNECFVERMDVDNDLIYFDGKNNILWRGKNYIKVKDDNIR